MEKSFNILIIGGDRRYLELIKKFSNTNNKLYLAGYDSLEFHEKNIFSVNLKSANLSAIDAILLPVAGIKKDGKIDAAYSDKEIKLTCEVLKQTPPQCIIFTGINTSYLDELAIKCDKTVIPLMKENDVAILNSIPTAEGVLKLAMEETDSTIHGSNVLILGYGRIGFAVAKLFHAVGAHVGVGIRKSSDASRAAHLGMRSVQLEGLKDQIHKWDICINTIPDFILSEEIISNFKPSAMIIDVASHPGGTDFNAAEQYGIKAIHALGLPGKIAPKTAGNIIAEAVKKSLHQIL